MSADKPRARIDLTALVVGLLYVVVAALFGLDHADRIDLEISWIPAVLLIGVGAASVVGSIVDRRQHRGPSTMTGDRDGLSDRVTRSR